MIKLNNKKIDWLISKVSSLENEVNELHEIINNLEVENQNNISHIINVKNELNYSNQQRNSLNEKLDFFTKTTYDFIENDSSSDSKIFSTLEFDKPQYEI